MKYNFKVGDKVQIREWDDMVKEFGLNCFRSVNCRFTFTQSMKYLCGEKATIIQRYKGKITLEFDNPKITHLGYDISLDMLKPAFEFSNK